jgi:hypothetical protein
VRPGKASAAAAAQSAAKAFQSSCGAVSVDARNFLNMNSQSRSLRSCMLMALMRGKTGPFRDLMPQNWSISGSHALKVSSHCWLADAVIPWIEWHLSCYCAERGTVATVGTNLDTASLQSSRAKRRAASFLGSSKPLLHSDA